MALPHLPLVTMFFKVGETGWSESHVFMTAPSGSPRPIYGIQSAASALATLRSRMLAWGVLLYRIRCSWLDVWRDSVYATPPVPGYGTGVTVPAGMPFYYPLKTVGPADDPWDVTSYRLEETELYRGEEAISGYPAGLQSQNLSFPFPTPYTEYSTATSTYFNALCGTAGMGIPSAGGAWGTLVRLKAGDGVASVAIASVVFTAGPPVGWTFTTVAPHGMGPGQAVRVLGITQNPANPRTKYNGTWNTITAAGSTFTVAYPTAANTFVGYTVGATATPIVLAARAYTNWLFDGTTHRKRGVPSDRPHGRRRRSVPTAVV